jgi:hypothetical protein
MHKQFPLAVALVAFALFAGHATAQTNLLPNGDFEQSDTAWSYVRWSVNGTEGHGRFSDNAHGGEHAVEVVGTKRLDTEAPRGLFFCDPIAMQPGVYRLKGMCRTSGQAGAQIQILTYDTDDPPRLGPDKYAKMQYLNIDKGGEWAAFVNDFKFDASDRWAIVLLRGSGIGSVWYDDVSLAPVTTPLESHLFPGKWAWGEEVYLIEDNIAPITLLLTGKRNALEYPVTLDMRLPQGMTAYSDFDLVQDGTQWSITLTREDMDKRLYLTQGLSGSASIDIWVRCPEQIEGGQFQWQLRSGERVIESNTAAITVLPPIEAGPRPQRFGVLFAWSLHHRMPRELWDDAYELYRSAGINCLLVSATPREPGSWREYLYERFKADGCRLLLAPPGSYHLYGRAERLLGTEHWEALVADGGVDMFAKFDDGVSEQYADQATGFFWDFESTVKYVESHDTMIASFARHKGLDPDSATLDMLHNDYRDEYAAYCERQVAQVVRVWGKFLHTVKPGAPLYMCQGSGIGRQIDYALYDDVDNITHQPMIYTSGMMSFASTVEDTIQYLQHDVWPFTWNGLLKAGGSFMCRNPAMMRLDMTTTATAGGAGLAHWPDLNRALDGYFIWEMARGARRIAPIEDLIYDGKRIDQTVTVQGLAESQTEIISGDKRIVLQFPDWTQYLLSRSYQLHKQRLVAIHNTHAEKPAFVRVALGVRWPADGYRVYDVASDTQIVPSGETDLWTSDMLKRGLVVTVGPLDSALLLITPQTRGAATIVRADETAAAYEATRSEGGGAGGAIEQDDMVITWDDVDGDGSIELLMQSPKQKLWLTPAGGRMWGWRTAGNDNDLVERGEQSGVGMDLFWLPESARWTTGPISDYRITDRTVEDGVASVTFERFVSARGLSGVLIRKTYRIDVDSNAVTMDLSLTSESPEPLIAFSYWSHNAFNVGGDVTLHYTAKDGEAITIDGTERNVFVHRDDVEDAKHPPIASGDVRIESAQAERAVNVSFNHDVLSQVYRWRSDENSTLEWMYQPVQLTPHESWTTSVRFEPAK